MKIQAYFILVGIFKTVLPYEISSRQLSYLQDFGYFNLPKSDARDLVTVESVKKAVVKFQTYAGIPTTGIIDDATLKMFKKPRCGLKDIVDDGDEENRKKRYTIKGLRWSSKVLTYRIENWTNDLSRAAVSKSIKKALGRWQAVSNLKFRYQSHGQADIMIKFARKVHGDAYKFDGPGGTLAHAFFPGTQSLAGDTHFDDDELFTIGTSHGKNFDWVAIHEFGHAIGLDHTSVKGAIMFPFYTGYRGGDFNLHEDDIKGVHFLYGVPKDYQTRTDPPLPELDEDESGCIRHVSTVTTNRLRNEVHVINRDKVYVYDGQTLRRKNDNAITLQKYFKNNDLDKIDAAYELPNGNIIYLRGNRSWEYKGDRLIRGKIDVKRRGFTSEMHDVDAVFYWSKAKKVYIFKGEIYWRYDPWRRTIDIGYPKRIQDSWVGIPGNINSVFEWNGNVFFFKGQKYYRFDSTRFMVLKGYPLHITNNFFLCQKHPQVSQLVGSEKGQLDEQVSSSSDKTLIGVTMLIFPNMVLFWLLFMD